MAETDLTKMSSAELVEALIKDNSLVSQFDSFSLWELIENKDWQKLVLEHPTFYKKMSGIAWFSASEWVELIKKNKKFVDVCTKWDAFSKEDWLRLLPTIDEKYLKKCKCWKNFSPDNWVDILIRYPNLATKCKSFDSFKEKQWNILLSKQPKLWVYSKKQSRKKIMQTGVVSDGLSLKSLSVDDWKRLIKQNPKNFEKLNSLKIFSIDDCIELLQLKDKAIIEKFDKWADLRKVDWDKLDTEVFKEYAKKYKNGRRSFLERHPAYLVAKKDYEERSRQSRWWEKITFSYAPALAEDFSIIEYIEQIPAIDVNSWEIILKKDKKYQKKCRIEAISPSNAVRLISIEPSLFAKYDSTKFTVEDWATILKQHPQFADKCTIWDFSTSDWREILEISPQLIEKCDMLDYISTEFLKEHCDKYPILEKYIPSKSVEKIKQDPTFIRECKCKNKISSTDWFDLLNTYPQLREYCDCYLNFTNDETIELIKLDIAFADNVLVNHKFDDAEEQRILAVDSNLWKYLPRVSVNEIIKDASKLEECKCVDRFSMQNWEDIVKVHPNLKANSYYKNLFPTFLPRKTTTRKSSTKIFLSDLDKKIIKKFGENPDVFSAVKKLISENPTLESKLLNCYYKSNAWNEFLLIKPDFYTYCTECILSSTWIKIIRNDPTVPLKTNRWQNPSSYTKSGYPEYWDTVDILIEMPELEERFIHWPALGMKTWEKLLLHQPSFIKHCNRLNELRWKDILYKHPHLWMYNVSLSLNKILENRENINEVKCLKYFTVHAWERIINKYPDLSTLSTYIEKYPSLKMVVLITNFIKNPDNMVVPFWNVRNMADFSINDKYYMYMKIPESTSAIVLADNFSSNQTATLLSKYPNLLYKLPIYKLNRVDLKKVLLNQPQLINQFKDISWKLSVDDWIDLIFKHIGLRAYFPYNDAHSVQKWMLNLICDKTYKDNCPDKIYDKLTQEQWEKLEAKHPGVFEDIHMLSTLRKLARD